MSNINYHNEKKKMIAILSNEIDAINAVESQVTEKNKIIELAKSRERIYTAILSLERLRPQDLNN